MTLLIAVAAALMTTAAAAAVVQPVGGAAQLLLPAAGSTAGANGTFFRSDIALLNFADHDQRVMLRWLPQAGSGAPDTTTITIPALSGIRSADFVRDSLNTSGLGSLIVQGVTSTEALDPSALLYIVARIWTQQPGSNGTVSQSLPAVPLSAVNTQQADIFAPGVVDDIFAYRTNVGIVNLDPLNAQHFVITVPQSFEPPVIPVLVPPMTMQQISLGPAQPLTIRILNDTPAATRSNAWTAYASTVDNTNGDAWSELAVATTP